MFTKNLFSVLLINAFIISSVSALEIRNVHKTRDADPDFEYYIEVSKPKAGTVDGSESCWKHDETRVLSTYLRTNNSVAIGGPITDQDLCVIVRSGATDWFSTNPLKNDPQCRIQIYGMNSGASVGYVARATEQCGYVGVCEDFKLYVEGEVRDGNGTITTHGRNHPSHTDHAVWQAKCLPK